MVPSYNKNDLETLVKHLLNHFTRYFFHTDDFPSNLLKTPEAVSQFRLAGAVLMHSSTVKTVHREILMLREFSSLDPIVRLWALRRAKQGRFDEMKSMMNAYVIGSAKQRKAELR